MELEGYDIRQEASGTITMKERRYKRRVINGQKVWRREWVEAQYRSIEGLFRSRMHTLDSQLEDVLDVIERMASLRDIELLLEGTPGRQQLDEAMGYLADILAWAKLGQVEGKTYAVPDLSHAFEALQAGHAELAVRQMADARRQLKESRVPEIKHIRERIRALAVGILPENYAGKLPLWLAPVQCVVATITSEADDYANALVEQLSSAGIRVVSDLRNEKINYKVREHSLAKVPVMFVVGKREAEEKTVAIRRLGEEKQSVEKTGDAIASLMQQSAPPY
jgi:hypothetical protein